MQISHKEARKLIQLDFDQMVGAEQKKILRSHLESCLKCREYANSIHRMASILTPLMHRKWNHPHAPLPVSAILPGKSSMRSEGMVLATRIAVAGVMAVVFLFSIWQVTNSSVGPVNTLTTGNIPPVPTPSPPLTHTATKSQACPHMIYLVQRNDTLDAIAIQFNVAKEEIMIANNMKNEILVSKAELIIPICNSNPTETVRPLTGTFTPLTSPTIATPSG